MGDKQIAGNKSLDAMIKYCYKFIEDKDRQKFTIKFNKQCNDSIQVMHTFRELLLGAYIGVNGFMVKYERSVKNKTPDWSVFDTNSKLIGIVELVNVEIDLQTKIDIKQQICQKGHASYWVDRNKDNTYRLYSSIQKKAQTYKDLVNKLGIFYIIAAFTEFKLKIYFKDELYPYLFNRDENLFKQYPEVSAVLCFEDAGDQYYFDTALNPLALRMLPFPIKYLQKAHKG